MSVKIITRSKGQSSIAAAAYRRGIVLKDDRTGITHDYSRKQRVIYSEILIPKNSPQWISDIHALQKTDPQKAVSLLWNSVEQVEKRKDAQLVREIEFSLPIELNQEQCIALAREYVQSFCDKGMVADFSIHWEKGNPHVHILLSMRDLTTEGWGQKARDWNQKQETLEHRKRLAEVINQHLKIAGFDKTVTHLSYAEQGLEIEPTVHQGNKKSQHKELSIAKNKGIRLRNLQKIIDNPSVILEKLSQESSTFSLEDIAKTLSTQLTPANQTLEPNPEPPRHSRLRTRFSSLMAAVAPKYFTPEPEHSEVMEEKLAEAESPKIDISADAAIFDVIAKVLEEITQNESVFTEQHLSRVLSRHVENSEIAVSALLQVKFSTELLVIGPGEDGRERYTTREMFDLENNLQTLSEQLNQTAKHSVHGRLINKCIQKFNLENDQAKAIRHILKGNDISIMVGRAGTGKSYSLKAAKFAWEASGYKVHGIALAGIAAENLAKDSGIESRVIESFCYALREGALTLSSKDIVVMDEAGMTDSFSFSRVMTAIKAAGAKLVLVGDPAQLQPVGPGAIFRALSEQVGFTELTTIRRQTEVWQRESTGHFAAGSTHKALAYYEKHDCITLSDTPQLAIQSLVNDWADCLKKSPLSENLMLAFQNVDVNTLNRLARKALIAEGIIKDSHFTQNEKGDIAVAIGERLLFMENNWRHGVKNGQRGTITDIICDAQNQVISIKVALDGDDNKTVLFNPNQYKKFSHGYAVTVHRSQGVTVNHSFVLASGHWNKHLSYVAMTRHRKTVKLYGDKETHKSIDGLKKGMSKMGIKDSTLDYPLAFAARRGIDIESVSARFQKHVFEKLKNLKQRLKDKIEQTLNPEEYWSRQEKDVEKQKQILETLARREDAKRVDAYCKASCETGVAAGALEKHREALGLSTNITKEERAFLNNHSLSKALSIAVAKRDEIATEIYSEHERYTGALEIRGISLEKLAKEHEANMIRQRVAQYMDEVKRGRVVHRDKLAFIIQEDIKAHYPALATSGVVLASLKAQANAHARRDIFRKSILTEREDFRTVESYLTLTRDSGRLWRQIIEKEKTHKVVALIAVDDLNTYQISRLQALAKEGIPISHEMLKKAGELVKKRDALAAHIVQNPERHKKALDFYEFGHLKTNSKTPSPFELRAGEYAKERLAKLEKQASLFILKEADQQFIQNYINNKDESRYEMAAQITKDKTRYGRIIYEIASAPRSLFINIKNDNEAYVRAALLKRLTEEEQAAFMIVEKYVLEKRTTGKIWIENKNSVNPQHPILKAIAEPHILLRDSLASAIQKAPERYTAALDHFKIKPEHLDKNAFDHQIREYLGAFSIRAGNLETRMRIARQIVSNRSAYPVIKENNTISWHQLQRYADYAIKMERIASLTPQEKSDYFTVLRYKRLRREAGKAWSQIFARKKEGLEAPRADFNKAIVTHTERNKLAFEIRGSYQRFNDFLFSGQVQTKDIQKHALAHSESLKNQSVIADIQKTQATQLTAHPEKIIKPYWDSDVVTEALAFNAASFIESLLGSPNQRLSNNTRYRYGKKGSLSVNVSGQYAGTWKDFESGEKGNLLTLIQCEYNFDFKQALQYAAEWAGIAPETKLLKQNKNVERQIYLKSTVFTPEQLEKIEYAQQIVSESIPITGTLAQRYLKEHRGISGPVLDKNFRFNPAVWEPETNKLCPALVVIARNSKQEVQSVQCIYLDSNTANKMDINVQKRTFGPLEGAAALVQEAKHVPNIGYQFTLAEGPETALSVAQSNPNLGVYVTLGVSNFSSIPIPSRQDILLCADNDGIEAASNKALNKAIDSLSERGLNVYLTKPIESKDFNDVLKKHGIDEINRLIDNKILVKEAMTLEQLIENKKSLVSPQAKTIVEFETKHREHEKIGEPKSIEDVQKKVVLFEQIGKIASFINDNVILREAATRHKIDDKVVTFKINTIEEQKWQDQAKKLIETINSKDPIKDYLEAIDEHKKLGLPHEIKPADNEKWYFLNDRIKQLAFIIDKTPAIQYKAKALGIYDQVASDSYQWKSTINQKLLFEQGQGWNH